MRMPRQAGQKEARFAHLLSGEPEPAATAEAVQRTSADRFDSRAAAASSSSSTSDRFAGARATADDERVEQMSRDIEFLRSEIEALRRDLESFRKSFE
jgi:uncharacterized protein YceH (UPF0502 family)